MSPANGAIAPFDGEGVWLRCSLHAHTTESDGWLEPAMLRRYYAAAGYDVLAITDHHRLTPAPRGDERILVLGGAELTLRAPRSGGPLDVLGLGIESLPQVGRESSLDETAAAIRACGGLAFVAHPVWTGILPEEVGDMAGVTGIEIFNGNVEAEMGRGHADAHWDLWLAMGRRLGGIATDDMHAPGAHAFRAWTMVRAAERSREAVLAALTAGRYYATTGPRIEELTWHDGTLTVRTTPVSAIALRGNPPFGGRVPAGRHEMAFKGEPLRTADGQAQEGILDGGLLTGAVFPNMPQSGFLRIEVTDEHGRRAWTNPLWL